MAQWSIAGRADYFDDGLTARPGEPGFSRDKVIAEAAGQAFDYVGTPNWTPPAADAETPAGE